VRYLNKCLNSELEVNHHSVQNISLCFALLESVGHNIALVLHLRFVLIQPSVALLRVVEIFGCAWVWLAKVRADIVAPCECCVVTALNWDRLGTRIIVHLHVENEGDLPIYFCGLSQEGVWSGREGTTLDAEALPRLHLPEETNLAVLFRQHPHAQQIASRDQGFIEVVA